MTLRTLCGVMVLAAIALTFLVAPGFDPAHAAASMPHPAISMAVIAMAGAPASVVAEFRKASMPSVSLAALMGVPPEAVIGCVRNDAQNIEKLLGDVRQELQRVGDDVKRTAEDALKQAKDSGGLSAEVKQKADELLMAQGKLSAAHDKLTEKLEALETRSSDLEQKMASRRGAGGADEPKSLGQMVTESDDVKNFFERSGAKGAVRITVANAITSATGSAGALISPQRDNELVGIPRRQMTIRQLLQVGDTTSNSIEYARQVLRTSAAAVVAEGALKPESNYAWELDDAPVRTIAHWIPISRQAMDDVPQLRSEIDGELRYGLDLAEETEVLKGDGTGQHLHGLVPQATPYADQGIEVVGATKIDILRLAILQASLAEYSADGIVINDVDWADIELTKDGEQRYIFANVIQLAGPQLWGRPVISTQAMDVDEFLVGAFRMAAKIWDRMDTEVLISSEDRDNFVKNMLTVRAEKRLALAVKRSQALVTGDFATAIAAVPAGG